MATLEAQKGISGQWHNESHAQQFAPSPSKAEGPVLLTPSAHCTHQGAGSRLSTPQTHAATALTCSQPAAPQPALGAPLRVNPTNP